MYYTRGANDEPDERYPGDDTDSFIRRYASVLVIPDHVRAHWLTVRIYLYCGARKECACKDVYVQDLPTLPTNADSQKLPLHSDIGIHTPWMLE